MQSMQQATQQVEALSTLLQQIQHQAQQTEQVMMDLLKTAKAPRIKKAIRGNDGKIERVEETIAA